MDRNTLRALILEEIESMKNDNIDSNNIEENRTFTRLELQRMASEIIDYLGLRNPSNDDITEMKAYLYRFIKTHNLGSLR